MDDAAFEELRGALAPSRDATSRTGALFVLEVSLDGDERLPSLFATLLNDRDAVVASGAAAIAYRAPGVRKFLQRDLDRAWGLQSIAYRRNLLASAAPQTLAELAEEAAQSPDAELCAVLARRLHEISQADKQMQAALLLSHHALAGVRVLAASELGRIGGPGARAALSRLMADNDKNVQVAAIGAVPLATATPEEAREKLSPLQQSEDLDIRAAAANALRAVQAQINIANVEPYVRKQAELNDAGDYNGAMALAAQVFMRVANHPACQYQMARAAAGMNDQRRALRLLANAFEAGYDDGGALDSDPLFEPLKQVEAWSEVMQARTAARSS